MGILERIADIENEINRTQKNKGKRFNSQQNKNISLNYFIISN